MNNRIEYIIVNNNETIVYSHHETIEDAKRELKLRNYEDHKVMILNTIQEITDIPNE